MNPFLCVVDLGGDPVGIDALTAALPAIGQSNDRAEVQLNGAWGAAWVPSNNLSRPAIAHRDGVIALGNVRITNRSSFPAPAGRPHRPVDDLDLVLEHYLRRGTAGFRDLIGDFAFVLWDTRLRQVVAVRDAAGVKTLFYQKRGNRLAVASHLDCFEPASYDTSFIGDFLIGTPQGTSRTIFSDVTRLSPGSFLVGTDTRVTETIYWSPAEFVPLDRVADEREAVVRFDGLFREAVAAQFDDGQPTWAQLSGGLDSSSVVAMAQSLAAEGLVAPLGGTQTVVDRLADGDETRYSDAVCRQYGLRNEQVVDHWGWQGDDVGPPAFADPRPFLPFFARDRAMRDIVRRNGGHVLLSGYGSDNYLAESYTFIADWFARGRVKDSVRQLVDLAVATRRSVWDMAGQHLVAPLAPRWLQRTLTKSALHLPDWIIPGAIDLEALQARVFQTEGARPGSIFAAQQTGSIGNADLLLERGLFEEGIEMRYPFLYRPLLEYALTLPVQLRFRPNRAKWILREAMGSRLPDVVRNRQGKGAIDGRIVWSFGREQTLLTQLIADSHLADLGIVSRAALEEGFERARTGEASSVSFMFLTLSLETWFAGRSGWWKRHASRALSDYKLPMSKEHHNVEAHLR